MMTPAKRLVLTASLLCAACTPPTATPPPAEPPTELPAPATIAAPDAEGVANAVYEHWIAGDKDGAAAWFAPDALAYMELLFDHPFHAADGWAFDRCEGAAGSVFCSWTSTEATLVIKVANLDPPPMVTEVRLDPATAP